MVRAIPCLCLSLVTCTYAQVTLYECDVFPENADPPWERAGTFDADRWVDAGWFYHFVELGIWGPPPIGENDVYRHYISTYAGEEAFFIQWEVESGAPPSDIDPDVNGTPCVLAAYGNGNANYHFTITNGRVRVIRNSHLPVVYVDIEPDEPHTYRLELYWDEVYAWYIDGELIDSGLPYGLYPREDSKIIWGSRYYLAEHTTRWNYVRYGRIIPGDVDSDGDLDLDDFHILQECISNNGPGVEPDPGCTFADINADGQVDFHDFAVFQRAFSPAP